MLSLAALAGCSSESAPSSCPDFRAPEVNVIDANTGARVCDAEVTIANNGDIFRCEPSGSGCNAPYRCNGPKLGGTYALRVKRGVACDVEQVITISDTCDDSQFQLEVALEPP